MDFVNSIVTELRINHCEVNESDVAAADMSSHEEIHFDTRNISGFVMNENDFCEKRRWNRA